MRRRIAFLAAGTTSAVILSFVLPLGLLVRTMAADRALAAADQEARSVAILVSSLYADDLLPELVNNVDDERSVATTTVVTAKGAVLGTAIEGIRKDPEVVRAKLGEAFTIEDDAGTRIYIAVITPDGNAVVRTSIGPEQLEVGVERAWLIIALLGGFMFLVAVSSADALGRRISRPVTELAGVAHRLREGELSARATPNGPPETVELGIALNLLAERIDELLIAERAAVGDLSHRLRTPVTALRLDAESVQQPEVAERLGEHIVNLQRAIDAIVNEARRPVRSSMSSGCDLRSVTVERVEFWSPLAEDQGRRFIVDVTDEPVHVALSDHDARDLLDVLIDNVFAHTPEGTNFALSLSAAADQAVLIISDRGPGMAPVMPDEPRRVGSTGLGLDIVERTVSSRGGAVEISSPRGGGTTVQIRLPVIADPAVRGSAHHEHR
jgi:signal transduction histidine kinase